MVLWALYLCRFVIRHMRLVLLITSYCTLLFERLRILLIDVENIPKYPAKSMQATLVYLITVGIAHVL